VRSQPVPDAAYLGDEAVERLYGGDRLLVHEGAGTQPGRAVPTDGGYLLSGEWRFASGVKHAQLIHTGSLVSDTGQPRICVFPVEQATLIDNWDVLGLRATGSIDYTTDSLFRRRALYLFRDHRDGRCAAASSTRWGSSTSA